MLSKESHESIFPNGENAMEEEWNETSSAGRPTSGLTFKPYETSA